MFNLCAVVRILNPRISLLADITDENFSPVMKSKRSGIKGTLSADLYKDWRTFICQQGVFDVKCTL
jgi:hypothetical protein